MSSKINMNLHIRNIRTNFNNFVICDSLAHIIALFEIGIKQHDRGLHQLQNYIAYSNYIYNYRASSVYCSVLFIKGILHFTTI